MVVCPNLLWKSLGLPLFLKAGCHFCFLFLYLFWVAVICLLLCGSLSCPFGHLSFVFGMRFLFLWLSLGCLRTCHAATLLRRLFFCLILCRHLLSLLWGHVKCLFPLPLMLPNLSTYETFGGGGPGFWPWLVLALCCKKS